MSKAAEWRRHAWFCLLLALGLCAPAVADPAAEPPSFQLSPDVEQIPVEQFDYMIINGEVSPEVLAQPPFVDRWRPYDARDVASQRLERDARYWLRFRVNRSAADSGDWVLAASWAQIYGIQLSTYDHVTGEWQHSRKVGETEPLAQRYVAHRYHLLPLDIAPNHPTTVYVSIKAFNLASIPIGLWQKDAYLAQDQGELILLGVFFGSLAIMLLYNLSIYTVLRDPAYLLYVVYVGSVILFELSSTGVGYFYLWGNHEWFARYALGTFASLCFLTAVVFVRYFLELPKHGGWLLAANNLLLGLWAFLTIACTFVLERWLGPIMFFASLLSCALGLITGGVLWYRGSKIAKIFTFAWLALNVATVIYTFAISGMLPLNWFTQYSQMMGFMIEMVLLSFALAYRINLEREQREQAQADKLLLTKRVSDERNERLRAQIQSLSLQKQLNDELEQRVNQRTEQLREAMEKLEEANSELTKLSITDPLTKVANRRYFDQVLSDECKRANRLRHPVAVVLMDIDHFKAVNDTYGHSVGDECLNHLAATLKAVAQRPGDLLARYGGEEFVYILPGSNEANAMEVAERCREAVATMEFYAGSEKLPLTLSAGVAAWVPKARQGADELLKAADHALYRAKHSGRNCVKTASENGKVLRI